MGIFDGVLLASDFDGTLASDGAVIDERNKRALRHFISEGGYFTVSTGRTYQGFHRYSPEYINAPVLLCNGAMLYDYSTEKICFCDGIDRRGIAAVLGIMESFPECAIELYPFGKTFTINPNEQVINHFTGQDISYTVVGNPSETVFPWVKAMIYAGEQSRELQGYLSEMKFPGLHHLPTDGSFVELVAENTDKGTGLLRLADMLGINRGHIYAAGDGYNDREMLTVAQAGFVPENGDSQLKESAAYTVRSNNNGCIENVIEILEEIYG